MGEAALFLGLAMDSSITPPPFLLPTHQSWAPGLCRTCTMKEDGGRGWGTGSRWVQGGGVRLWGLWTSCSFVNTALGSHVQIWLQGTCAGRKGVQLLAPIHLCVSR